jgi:transcriptional regulator with XRE-family HTH domain
MAQKSRNLAVGRRIVASRVQRGLTQAVVSRRAGIAPSYLSRIETGRVHPTVGTALRIAAALRMSLDELLGSTAVPDHRTCPVSRSGRCLMDLIATGVDSDPDPERFTPRQIRLLRRFAALVQEGSPHLLRALEVLVAEVLADRSDSRR